MKNFKDRPHLWWLGLAVLLLVAESVLFYAIWASFAERDQWSIHTYQVLEEIESFQSTLKDAETGQRGYLLTAKDEYLEPYLHAIQVIPIELDELRKLTSDNPAEQSRIEILRSLIAKTLGEARKTIDLRRTGHAAAAVDLVSTDRGNQTMNQIRTVIQAMKAQELSLLDWRNERRLATARSMILVMTLGAGILLLVLLAGSRSIDRSTTARARAEAAEKTQREWLQVTLASIGDGVIATDASGRITLINPVAALLTGWSPDEALSQPVETVFAIRNEETGNAVENPGLQAIRDGRIVGLANHTILISKDGRHIPLDDSGAPIVDASGKVRGAVLIFRDISEKKVREAELRRRDRMLRYSLDAILITGPERRIQSWNRGAFELYGWDEAEVRDKISCDFLRTSPPITEVDEVLLRQGQWRGELVHTCKDGTVVTVESRQVLLRDTEGRFDGVLEINRDITERKRAEQEMAWLASFPQRNVCPIAEVELLSGVVQYVNPAARDLFPDLLQRGFSHPWLAGLQQVPGTLAEKAGNSIFREITVGDRCYAQSVSPITEKQRLRVYGIDITKRKRAEEALHEQRQWLQVTLNSIGDAVLATDGKGKVTFLNPVAVKLTGWTEEQALGLPAQDVFRIINEQTREKAEDIIGRVLRERSVVSLANHTVIVTRDGREIPVEDSAAPIQDNDGNLLGVVLVFHDVAEKRRAQEALRESESQFRTLANAIPQLCWIANADGWITWYNQRWYEYTGTTPEQMEGWGWQAVHDPEVLPQVLKQWKDSIASGKPFDMVFPLRGADGVYRPFLTRGMPVCDRNGRVARWFGTNTDISERKRIEEALRRSNEDLEQFAYVASHDLQEPLRTITAYTQLLERMLPQPINADLQQYTDFIVSAASRMTALIRGLLEYSRAAKVRPVQSRPVAAEVALKAARENLGGSIEATHAVVTNDPLPQVFADRGQLTQVFQNLLSNSIKYRRPVVPPQVHVGAEHVDGEWVFRVKDNGQGFAPEYGEKIFRIFQRLHGGEVPGTGIGLAIVKTIVERNGGRVGANAEPGKGATFYFTLPGPRPEETTTT